MDVQMPVMDGFQATAMIRAWEKEQKRSRTPIVAVTAHAMVGYRDNCLKNDMDDYLTKPLKKKALLDKLNEWIDKSPDIIEDSSVENHAVRIINECHNTLESPEQSES
jgi:CheY-like chemotaxis protein